MFAMMFASCTKNESDLAAVQKTVDPTSQKILAFKAKVASGDKSAETMSLDSAVWYVEAALNFTYCMHTENEPVYSEVFVDSFKIDFTAENGKVNFTEIAPAYLNIAQHTQNVFEQIENQAKDIVLQDVDYADGQLTIKTFFATGTTDKATTFNWWFTEDWKFGWNMGRCDGTYAGLSDAAKQLNSKINMRIPHINGYYTDNTTISSVSAWSGDFYNSNSNDPNYCQYYIFLEGGDFDPYGTYSTCITVPELNFYINGAFIAADVIKQNHSELATKQFIGVNYFGDGIPGDAQNPIIMHFGAFTYAIGHTSDTEL